MSRSKSASNCAGREFSISALSKQLTHQIAKYQVLVLFFERQVCSTTSLYEQISPVIYTKARVS